MEQISGIRMGIIVKEIKKKKDTDIETDEQQYLHPFETVQLQKYGKAIIR